MALLNLSSIATMLRLRAPAVAVNPRRRRRSRQILTVSAQNLAYVSLSKIHPVSIHTYLFMIKLSNSAHLNVSVNLRKLEMLLSTSLEYQTAASPVELVVLNSGVRGDMWCTRALHIARYKWRGDLQ